MPSRPSLAERGRKIRLIILDVDGVLTDGQLLYGPAGEIVKKFHIQDGLAMVAWRRAGGLLAVMSGRRSRAVGRRLRELGAQVVYQGVNKKLSKYREILARFRCRDDEVAVMGDDLADLPLLARAGLAIAPSNGAPEVRAEADLVTRRAGGMGAVREAVEWILKTQGRWTGIVQGYREGT